MGTTRYDLVIIGSGSAAFSAAIAARRENLSVVMVEKSTIGGTCVNVGCIPSKALLAAAKRHHLALEQIFPGVVSSAQSPEMVSLIRGKQEIVDGLQLEKYISLADFYGIEIKKGKATFIDGPKVQVGNEVLKAKHYLIATGARPWAPPIDGLESIDYLTSTTALEVSSLPESLIVIGANAIGLELGQLFAHLGSKVTIVEALDRIAPFEEPEVSEALASIFTDEGIDVITGAKITHAAKTGNDKSISLATKVGVRQTLRASEILVATGRRPNTLGLGLELVEVKTGPKGEVVVDRRLRTTNPQIWAAGDVTGLPQFVYVAGTHGKTVVDNAFLGADTTVDYHTMPRVTFTSPAIASVGLTDYQAQKAGYDCDCRVLPLSQVPRAIVERDTRGVVKIVADSKTNKILGVHLLAAGAGDVILSAVYALSAGFSVDQMANIWSPYLTMGEALKLTAQSFTRNVAELSCCAS